MNDELREVYENWLEKAYNDWKIVEILLKDKTSPLDGICFHCQQYVEKLIKALLTRKNKVFPKTHDIRELIELAEQFLPALNQFVEDAEKLTIHGVVTRYPQQVKFLTEDKMKNIVDFATRIGKVIEKELQQQ